MHWDPPVSRRLMAFLGAASAGTVAAFDADGTLWSVDVGEAFLRWAGEEGKLPGWAKGAAAWNEYERRLATGDLRNAFEFCVTAFAGLQVSEVTAWANAFVAPAWDAHIFPAMRTFVASLREREAEVWVVSGSPAWCVVPGAALLGIPATRIIAAVPKLDGGRVTDALDAPIPTQEAKPEQLERAAGRAAHFAAGNSAYDYPLLESARTLALLVDPPADDGWKSRKNGDTWLVQRFTERQGRAR